VQSAAEAVEDGQGDVGLTQVSEILPRKNAELAGPLPHDIQKFTTFAVGVRSQDSEASAAFLQFLVTPAAIAVMREKGPEPL
jgi:molybdate transport system substrate-binding protein